MKTLFVAVLASLVSCVTDVFAQCTPPAAPTINATTFSVCPDITGTARNYTYSTASGYAIYNWTVTGGSITSPAPWGNTITVDWSTSVTNKKITLSVGNVSTCVSALTTQLITDRPVHQATINGSSFVCSDNSNNVYTTESGFTNYIWTYDGGPTITAGGTVSNNTVTITWPVTAIRAVRVKYTTPDGCVSYPAVKMINQASSPTLNGNDAVCEGSTENTYTTETGRANYVWTAPGGVITSGGGSNDNTAKITWVATGNQTVSIKYDGCNSTASTAVYVAPSAPTITGSAIVNQNCTASYFTESGMSNYQWTATGGTVDYPNSSSVNVYWTGAGVQTLSVNYTASGCSGGSTNKVVTVETQEIPSVAGENLICDLMGNYTYVTEPEKTDYQWTAPSATIVSGGTANDNSVTLNFGLLGSYVRVRYKNAKGCTSAEKTYVVNRHMPVMISGDDFVCPAQSYTYSTSTGMSAYRWEFSPGGTKVSGGGSTDNFITLTWNGAAPQWVSAGYTNAEGCELPLTIFNVGVSTLPSPTIDGPASVCIGGNATFTTQTGMSNYTWSHNGTLVSGQGTNAITLSYSKAGPKTISVNYQNSDYCAAAVPVSKAFEVTQPTIEGLTSVCAKSQHTYSTQTGMTDYIWTLPVNGTLVAGGNGHDFVTILWGPSATVESLQVSYTNAVGCAESSETFLVSVMELPEEVINGNSIACTGTQQIYSIDTNSDVQWSFSEQPEIISGQGTKNLILKWLNPGDKIVTASYTTSLGCVPQEEPEFNVHVDNPVLATISASTSRQCADRDNLDDVNGIVFTTEEGMENYRFTASGGAIIYTVDVNENPVEYISNGYVGSGPGIAPNKVRIYWTQPGNHTVAVNYSNPGTVCSSSASTSIIIDPRPTASLSANVSETCAQKEVTFTTDANQYEYQWQYSNATLMSGGTSTDYTITVLATSSPSSTVTVSYKDALGCADEAQITIPVWYLPTPGISSSINRLCVDSEESQVFTTESGNLNYEWIIPSTATVIAGGTANNNTVTIRWNPGVSEPQSVSVFYKEPVHGCRSVSSQQKVTTFIPHPLPTIGRDAGCISTEDTYTTQNGYVNYNWSFTGVGNVIEGGASTDSFIKIKWSTSGAKSVTVNYESPEGCLSLAPGTNEFIVKERASPTLSGAFEVPVTSPLGAPISEFESYFTDAGMDDYFWQVDGQQSYFTRSVGFPWTSLGSHTVAVSYVDMDECSSYWTTKTVKVGYPQTLQFSGTYGPYKFGDAPFAMSVSGGSSTKPIVLSSSDQTVLTINGYTVTIVGAGTAVIRATREGDGMYLDAQPVDKTIIVNKKPQTITFTQAPIKMTVGDVFQLQATASSGLPIIYTSAFGTIIDNNFTATVANTTATIQAEQVGDNLNEAATKTITFAIYKIPSAVISTPSTNYCGEAKMLSVPGNDVDCTYLWSTGATTASTSINTPGTYTVQVTNGAGYVATGSITISDALPSITLTGPATLCNSGTPTLTAPPGTSYQWFKDNVSISKTTQSIVPVAAGNYTVKVVSPSGCSGLTVTSKPLQIAEPFSLSISGDDKICTTGGKTLLQAVTVLPAYKFNYLWSDGGTGYGITATAVGTYSVTLTEIATGCKNTKSVTVTGVANSGMSISVSPNVTCFTSAVTLTVSPAQSSYTWYRGSVNLGVATRSISVNERGNYNVVSGAYKACRTMWPCYEVRMSTHGSDDIDLGMQDEEEITFSEFSLYPNPADGELVIELSEPISNEASLTVYNQLGVRVAQHSMASGQSRIAISTSDLATGLYFINVSSDGATYKRKIKVEHKSEKF